MIDFPVHRIELPNPFFEGRTNAYVIVGEPLTLIDCGIGTEESFRALEQGFRAQGLALSDLRQIVLTHHHMDHFGQAWRLRDLSGATVYVHQNDAEAVTRYQETLPEFTGRLCHLLEQAGASAADIETVTRLFTESANRLARSVPAERLHDGQRVVVGGGELEVIHTPGHTLGCICLRFGRYLFSGDHVLPDISPNIGSDVAGAQLLNQYLASLERVKALQADDLCVLPGHGGPFHDLHGRAATLIAHHQEREQVMLKLVQEHGPCTIYQLATRMFGRLQGYHIVLGAAETWAHLEKLVDEGFVKREGNLFRAD